MIERPVRVSGDPFPLPRDWSARGLELRAVMPDDEPFLRDLYADFRAEELALTAWSEEQKRAFTDSQFDLQDRHFRASFPTADYLIILCDGRPIGRLYLNRVAAGFLVIDIGFLSRARGHGLGGELLRHIQMQARRAGAARVWLHVLNNNLRATALYSRLGFQRTGQEGAHWRMEWPTRERISPS